MTFLLILLFFGILSAVIILCLENVGEGWKYICMGSSIILFIYVLCIFGFRVHERNLMIEYSSLKSSLQIIENQKNSIENNLLVIKIVEMNQKIMKSKFWNKTFLDIFHIDEFANSQLLKPIIPIIKKNKIIKKPIIKREETPKEIKKEEEVEIKKIEKEEKIKELKEK